MIAATASIAGVSLAAAAWASGEDAIGPALLVMVAPALLVWFRPQPRTIGVWTAFAWFSALMLVLGDQYRGHAAIHAWLDVFLPVLLATLPIAGYGASAFTSERLVGEPSPLARKLRSIAAVAFLLALGLAVIGFFPGKRCDAHGHAALAGGLPLLVLLAVAIGPGFHVYANPTRTHGWRWTIYGLGLVLPGAALWSLTRGSGLYADAHVILWPQRVVELGVGTLLALLLLVLPAVLLFARGDDDPAPSELPPARLR